MTSMLKQRERSSRRTWAMLIGRETGMTLTGMISDIAELPVGNTKIGKLLADSTDVAVPNSERAAEGWAENARMAEFDDLGIKRYTHERGGHERKIAELP